MVVITQRGFTLIELLVTIAILSALVSLAAPSFSTIWAEQRLRQASSEMRISLTTARSEAIKRGESVVVVPRESNWSKGWCVEADASASECTGAAIQGFAPLEFASGENITVSASGAIRFNLWGRAAGCPHLSLNTSAPGGQCSICMSVATDGRVMSVPGTCTGTCPSADDETAWAGACP